MLKILDELAQYIADRAVSADVTIAGRTYPIDIRRKVVEGNTVKVHLYVTRLMPFGTVSRARLYGKDGKLVAERTDPQQHESGKSLLLEFKFTIQEVG